MGPANARDATCARHYPMLAGFTKISPENLRCMVATAGNGMGQERHALLMSAEYGNVSLRVPSKSCKITGGGGSDSGAARHTIPQSGEKGKGKETSIAWPARKVFTGLHEDAQAMQSQRHSHSNPTQVGVAHPGQEQALVQGWRGAALVLGQENLWSHKP